MAENKGQKRKKVDYAALSSPFMRIGGMRVEAARALLDLRFTEVYQLKGRDPDSIFDDLCKVRIRPDAALKKYFNLAVDFAENEDNM